MLQELELAPASGKVKQLVLILHGYGADAANLMDLAYSFAPHLPDAHFIAPNAIANCELGSGYQWFSLKSRAQDFMYAEIKEASKILQQYVDLQLKRFALTYPQLIMVGFSQGAMMSLHLAPRLTNAIAGVVGFSGCLVGGAHLAAAITAKPKTLLVHGDLDEVVPYEAMAQAAKTLTECAVEVQTITCKNLGHSINDQGMRGAIDFLKTLRI